MKKRLLITSIVMMLVVAVALSTATYAWFTSNANVTASTISLTAATNTADAIAIKWEHGTYGTAITTTQTYDNLLPVIPNEIVVNQTTLGGNGEHKITFQTAQIYTDNSISKFKEVGAGSSVAFKSNAASGTTNDDLIFIQNSSTANVVRNLKVTATISPNYIACASGELAVVGYNYYKDDQGTATDSPVSTGDDVTGLYKATTALVRVGIFTRDLTEAGTDDAENSDFILRGILASTASNTYFGTIANGNSQTAFAASSSPFANNTVTATEAATGFNICYNGSSEHTLAAQGVVALKVIMWLDGEALNDNTQGAIATVALNFEVPAAQQQNNG